MPTADAICTVGDWFFAGFTASPAQRLRPRTGAKYITYDEDPPTAPSRVVRGPDFPYSGDVKAVEWQPPQSLDTMA